ncbi:hypothetical protein INR49_007239, partial [Caranx melampygus]
MSHNSEFLSTHEEELRVVILGRPGTGKSSSGNTILGQERFDTDYWRRVTPHCSQGSAVVDGQHISVIDTPDQFIMRGIHGMTRDLHACACLAAPGPHVFLVVTRLDRFTEEDKQLMQDIKEMFSPDVDRYCMVLFTGGDQLEDTMEELLDRSPGHRDLMTQCHGQYHVFNNKLKDQSQVTELLHKIRNMVQKNGGQHYTNEMFQEVTRNTEERKQASQTKKEEECGGQRAE